jgi:hypothetical protein
LPPIDSTDARNPLDRARSSAPTKLLRDGRWANAQVFRVGGRVGLGGQGLLAARLLGPHDRTILLSRSCAPCSASAASTACRAVPHRWRRDRCRVHSGTTLGQAAGNDGVLHDLGAF